jgi:DNA sulfur modification protein DndC
LKTAEDVSLKNTIENGAEWMEPLLELRTELKETQDPEKRREVRELKRRSGQMKLVDEIRKKAFEENIQESRSRSNISERLKQSDPYSVLIPGPYTMEFCQEFLEKLLRGQKKVRKNGPDPHMELILESELHEIQRIWRMERGDWKNSVYQIYEKVFGEKIIPPQEDLNGFGSDEQEILEDICAKNNVPQLLVSKLLNVEFNAQGMTRHSKVYKEINKVLSEEWREDLDEIVKDLKDTKKRKLDLGG